MPVLTCILTMTKLEKLKRHLKPGQAYRRADFARWSTSVDRHLKQLVEQGVLKKLSSGLYACPKETVFGPAPASDNDVVSAFLKDDTFLLASPNAYNSLGVGTTQLYDKTVVYNHKRHGEFQLGNRKFAFRVKPRFPKSLTPEFLLVDLVNNLDQLAEAKDGLLDEFCLRPDLTKSLPTRRGTSAPGYTTGLSPAMSTS
ncbi:hypothetical protein LRP30_31210 [Bradyrhizobium sp. C-145]|uniref:hypothetical protein n=1 Tax=Bradyrhizobium sp. C-145 TaxID=574727 RepID=UPI00201B5079|nr:hypothetical protein [Bradyrhizobium sp. C-145]UQR61378.1 hypothetical protein LRP30_31210 [Bradyrhizobium sp. C-145]